MLRTDHRYPPTAHAPLGPPVVDYHHETITMPVELPTIERLTPSPACGSDICNQGRGDPCRNGCVQPLAQRLLDAAPAAFSAIDRGQRRADRAATLAMFAFGAIAFTIGYVLGRWLP